MCVDMSLLQVHILTEAWGPRQESFLVSLYSIHEVGSQLDPELVYPGLTNQPVSVSPCVCLLSTGITGGSLHCLDIDMGSGKDRVW